MFYPHSPLTHAKPARYPDAVCSLLMLLYFIFAHMSYSVQANEMIPTQQIIIAHRGASGYLPEHTLAAKSLAVSLGADFIEQDIVLSRDGIAVVLHDIYLDAVTNVADTFPGRQREDGRFYVIDFDLTELQQLQVNERIDLKTGLPRYPHRFPAGPSGFSIPTLEEEILLLQGLMTTLGRDIGIYPEIKDPAWHHHHGYDISRVVLDLLAQYGYAARTDHIYLQSFDPAELQRIRDELGSDLKLVQLIGENDWNETDIDYDYMRTPDGLATVALYADGIGPAINHVLHWNDNGLVSVTTLTDNAHRFGLVVHPYTLRRDSLPEYLPDHDALLTMLFDRAGVDGIFTDFPDLAVRLRDSLAR
jgi:glycerophosphoryl diester phosphodiesterase